ncbi:MULTISPECIES: hypothetical protein [unclassified Nonomuraea]|uniref:hypothetical protein n=1 Tax=unclassified Nonomuraea TaxID=2593643 RepID=UPI0033E3D8A0
MSTWTEVAHVLADELERSEALGPFAEEDYRLRIADQLLQALDTRKYVVMKRNTMAELAPPPATVVSASTPVTVEQLYDDPGMIVQRHTTQEEGSDRVVTELPCCHRPLTVPADSGLEVDVVCQFDRVLYTLRLAEEWDGGLLACFEVAGRVMVAKRRPAKRRVAA